MKLNATIFQVLYFFLFLNFVAKECLDKELLIGKPELKLTTTKNIVNLIVKKESAIIPSNLLNQNNLMLYSSFYLNEEEFPYDYELSMSHSSTEWNFEITFIFTESIINNPIFKVQFINPDENSTTSSC